MGRVVARRNGGVLLQYNGESLTIRQWSQKVGISEPTIRMRLRRGWSVKRALTTSAAQGRLSMKGYTYKGKPVSLRELSDMSGLSVSCIYGRLSSGASVEQVVRTKIFEWRDR